MSDVIQVTRLHMDYLKAFDVQPQPRQDDDWAEEDEEIARKILEEIGAGDAADEPDDGEEDLEENQDGRDPDY
jgi:hypothetical protein